MKLPTHLAAIAERSRGFTLLELMTAITVLAILTAIGVPAFGSLMRNGAIASEANNLVSAMNVARSEAMKRGVRVSLCPAPAKATECTKTSDWSGGILVFEDDWGAAGALNPNDKPIQHFAAAADAVTITGSAPISSDAEFVVFMPSAALSGSARTFNVTKTGCTQNQRRQIVVAMTGRISLTRVACT